ncbi:MAG: tRNA (N6-threonylcarbamoyladenosine(37)-N6)-methyltransferase TrmO [Sedimenticola sp.]|nr:tRNA (N6-threonylcarbamoyladenosine(37)-N6)-methyltransferase TrmO [Sedimenticola sp.]
MAYQFQPIGTIQSPFKEKFGIPRQPGLVPELRAQLVLSAPYSQPEAVAGLEGYSHIWIQFLFHRSVKEAWQPMVRPPRLGGNRRVGVFASRSPFRPNPIGLSVVRLERVRVEDGGVVLDIAGADLLDGTPVLDIKPYLPYVDNIPAARSGFAPQAPPVLLKVRFTQRALEQIGEYPEAENLESLIRRLLELDPRPAYSGKTQPARIYGMRLYDFDLRWRVDEQGVEVLELAAL